MKTYKLNNCVLAQIAEFIRHRFLNGIEKA